MHISSLLSPRQDMARNVRRGKALSSREAAHVYQPDLNFLTRLTPANLYEGEVLSDVSDDFLSTSTSLKPDTAEQLWPVWDDRHMQVAGESPATEALEELASLYQCATSRRKAGGTAGSL
jgi:hypothetical protein